MSQKWPTLWNCTHVQFIAAVYRLSIYTFGTGWGYRVQHLNNLTQKWEKNHTVNVITPTSKSNSHINLSDRECVVDMNVTHFALSLLSPQFDWIIDKYMPIPVHNKFNFQPTNTAKIARMNSTTYYTYPAESKSIEYIHDPLILNGVSLISNATICDGISSFVPWHFAFDRAYIVGVASIPIFVFLSLGSRVERKNAEAFSVRLFNHFTR